MQNTIKKEILKIKNLKIDPYVSDSFLWNLKRKVLMESYYEFFKWSFKILHPADSLTDAPHIEYICNELQKEVFRIVRSENKTKDIILNVPPRTSKSLIVSVCLLPWIWLHKPSLKMINVSYDESLVIGNSRMCRDIIVSEEYQILFGDIFRLRSDSNSVAEFSNNKTGARKSKTIGSNITGHGGEIIVVDDPQSPETANSEAERNKVDRYWHKNLYNRLTPVQTGLRVLVQQRVHPLDLSGILLAKNISYNHICLPAKLDGKTESLINPPELKRLYTENYLDPIRLGPSILEDFRESLGSLDYSAQYLQNPQNTENGILKKEWFPIANPSEIVRDREKEPIHFFLDTAYTEKEKNDPSAILAAWKRNNEIYVVRSESKRLEFPDLIRYIQDFVKAYGYSEQSRIYVEPKASGKSVVQQLKKTTKLNVVEDAPPKDDKVSRINAISPIVESKRVNIVQGGWNEDFLNQVCSISELVMPPHDDEADCLCMAVRKLLVDDSEGLYWI